MSSAEKSDSCGCANVSSASTSSCPCGTSCSCAPPCKCVSSSFGSCIACKSESASMTVTCGNISSEFDINKLSPKGSVGEKQNFRWQQIMLRIKNPEDTIPFYEKNFGMTCVHSYDFSSMGFSIYFMEKTRDGVSLPPKNTKESEKYIWNTDSTLLELTHNHGTENDDNVIINNGNVEPYRGFGHIAFNTNDVYEQCKILEKNGVKFHKKPDEGRMKGLAFALDPNGYFIEIVKRIETANFKENYNLSQCMIRVKDIGKSLHFYVNIIGMHLVRVCHYDDFSLYFLACLPTGVTHPHALSSDSREFAKSLWNPLLELTHNHGTEKQNDFSYHNGNDKPQGFGHIGFLCDDLIQTCNLLQQTNQVVFKKKPEEGTMRGIAFVYDPDMYYVELIQKGITFSDEKK